MAGLSIALQGVAQSHTCGVLFFFFLPGKEVLVPGFNIAGLLPANLKLYFHYNGSLTTPPCYQSVKWTVFNQTMMISHAQVCQGNEFCVLSCPASHCKPAPSVLVPWSSSGSQTWDAPHSAHTILLPDVNAGDKPET